MANICFVTNANREFDDRDEPRYFEATKARGWSADVCCWDDPTVDWGQYDAAIIRSPWNYIQALPEFLAWLRRVDQATTLLNPLSIVEPNVDKKYLLDWEAGGVPIVPTILRHDADDLGPWPEFVMKPAVSAGSVHTYRMTQGDPLCATKAGQILRQGPLLIQPYVPSVSAGGEMSLVFQDGSLTHTLVKAPRFHGELDNVTEGPPATPEQLVMAERALALLPEEPLYARVDLMLWEGRWVLSELELIEPFLYLEFCPSGAELLIRGIARRLA